MGGGGGVCNYSKSLFHLEEISMHNIVTLALACLLVADATPTNIYSVVKRFSRAPADCEMVYYSSSFRLKIFNCVV